MEDGRWEDNMWGDKEDVMFWGDCERELEGEDRRMLIEKARVMGVGCGGNRELNLSLLLRVTTTATLGGGGGGGGGGSGGAGGACDAEDEGGGGGGGGWADGRELWLTASPSLGACGRMCLKEESSAAVRGRVSPTRHGITPLDLLLLPLLPPLLQPPLLLLPELLPLLPPDVLLPTMWLLSSVLFCFASCINR